MALLEVAELAVRFATSHGDVRAVNGVSFNVEAGATVGLVGESGSGKSVTSLAIMGMLPSRHAHVDSGRIVFDGCDLLTLPNRQLRARRGAELAMVFQNPVASLNPVVKIGTQIAEAIRAHRAVSRAGARSAALELLERVSVPDPVRVLDSYPHRLSGGMCQRVMIAIALALRPKLLIADEPTTALDVTIQAQVLELLRELTTDFGTAVILITHDLGVVAAMTSQVHVMYAGRIVESAPTETLFSAPRHPYTLGLIRSVARSDRATRVPVAPIPGQPPDPTVEIAGCPFHPRCAWRLDVCTSDLPALAGPAPHVFACHNPLTPDDAQLGRPAVRVPA
jgi:oligopeptide/dipeptide ABC transporter ATP-binding protein